MVPALNTTPLLWLTQSSRYVALLAAWIATCGSLFFSEVLGWVPCILCWYQRILMYPLALIITIGILRRDEHLHWSVLPFSIAGACVSLYHYLLIKTDWFPPPTCTAGIPCNVDYIDLLGFINIPFLAFTAFLIITFMMVAATIHLFDESNETDQPEAIPMATTQPTSLLNGANLIAFGIIALVVTSFIVAGQLV
jgi:disulfide bond formation protein DsbB